MTAAVLFRVDASPVIGTGHVARCLALAEALRARGATCTFVTRPASEPWMRAVREHGHELLYLPAPDGGQPEPAAPPHAPWLATSQERDVADCIALLGARPEADWLVVDHYALDGRWELAARALATQVLAIDDLADRPHECDLLVDQNFRPDAHSEYAGLVPARSRLLCGPHYALLRAEFTRQRGEFVLPRGGPVRHVLVCFGGSAPAGANLRVLRALRSIGELSVTVIAPPADHEALSAAGGGSIEVRMLAHCDDMAALMRASDLGIGGGGGMIWERFSQGLPSLVLGIAANQRAGIAQLLRAGLILGHTDLDALDDNGLQALIRCLVSVPPLRDGQARRAQELVDGRGATRVARLMVSPRVYMRRATASDMSLTYGWRNHPQVREHALDARSIDLESHEKWFARVLADPNRLLLVAEAVGQPVGVVRFDLREDGALISVYLDPGQLHRGLGPTVVRRACLWLVDERPAVITVRAEIRNTNAASLAAFAEAGFREYLHVMVWSQERT